MLTSKRGAILKCWGQVFNSKLGRFAILQSKHEFEAKQACLSKLCLLQIEPLTLTLVQISA
jgi:phosphopantetheinyl transferase